MDVLTFGGTLYRRDESSLAAVEGRPSGSEALLIVAGLGGTTVTSGAGELLELTEPFLCETFRFVVKIPSSLVLREAGSGGTSSEEVARLCP